MVIYIAVSRCQSIPPFTRPTSFISFTSYNGWGSIHSFRLLLQPYSRPYKVPYILPSSLYRKSLVCHSSKNWGMYGLSSQFGTLRASSFSSSQWCYLSSSAIMRSAQKGQPKDRTVKVFPEGRRGWLQKGLETE